jgi:septation ring formation regulator EzrA
VENDYRSIGEKLYGYGFKEGFKKSFEKSLEKSIYEMFPNLKKFIDEGKITYSVFREFVGPTEKEIDDIIAEHLKNYSESLKKS